MTGRDDQHQAYAHHLLMLEQIELQNWLDEVERVNRAATPDMQPSNIAQN